MVESEKGREGERGRDREREGGREGGREGERERGREGGRERERDSPHPTRPTSYSTHCTASYTPQYYSASNSDALRNQAGGGGARLSKEPGQPLLHGSTLRIGRHS